MSVYPVILPTGTRGDAFERAVALTFAGPVVNGAATRIPMPAASVTALTTAYTLMQAQFKVNATDTTALITMSSVNGDIRIEPAYPLPDGTTGPALVLKFTPAMTEFVIPRCVWDVQFSGAGVGPVTWIGGDWSIEQDVTHIAADPLLP